MNQINGKPSEALTQFIQESLSTQKVWGLHNEEGWLSCESVEFADTEVMPFWSSPVQAKLHNVEEWADFTVTEIPLDVFVEDWLLTLDEDGVLIGANWDINLNGQETEPKALAKLYLNA